MLEKENKGLEPRKARPVTTLLATFAALFASVKNVEAVKIGNEAAPDEIVSLLRGAVTNEKFETGILSLYGLPNGRRFNLGGSFEGSEDHIKTEVSAPYIEAIYRSYLIQKFTGVVLYHNHPKFPLVSKFGFPERILGKLLTAPSPSDIVAVILRQKNLKKECQA